MSNNSLLDLNGDNDFYGNKKQIELLFGSEIEKMCKKLSDDKSRQFYMIEKVERLFAEFVSENKDKEKIENSLKEKKVNDIVERIKEIDAEIMLEELRDEIKKHNAKKQINKIMKIIIKLDDTNEIKNMLFGKLCIQLTYVKCYDFVFEKWINLHKEPIHNKELEQKIYNYWMKCNKNHISHSDMILYLYYEKYKNTLPLKFNNELYTFIIKQLIFEIEEENIRLKSLEVIIHKNKLDLVKLGFNRIHFYDCIFISGLQENDHYNKLEELFQYSSPENESDEDKGDDSDDDEHFNTCECHQIDNNDNKCECQVDNEEVKTIKVCRDKKNRFTCQLTDKLTIVFNTEKQITGKIDPDTDEIITLTNKDKKILVNEYKFDPNTII